MCWTGSNKRNIADKDLLCYKILKRIEDRSGLTSEYFDFVYELKKLYETQICKNICWLNDSTISIYEGFHSYSKDVVVSFNKFSRYSKVYVFARNKLFNHEFTDICNPVLVECTIPKGSIYYENKYGEIVSNKIIIEKEIDWHLKQL